MRRVLSWPSCTSDASVEYVDFLQSLGQMVRLRGWTGYRGGLDVDGRSRSTAAARQSGHPR